MHQLVHNPINRIMNINRIYFENIFEQNKYRREISNSNLWEVLKKESGEYDFDEEA